MNNSLGITKTKIILIVAGVLLLAVVAAAIVFRTQLAGLVTGGGVSTGSRALGESKLQLSIAGADAKVASGDTNGALNDLTIAIDKTDDKEEKSKLYAQKAAISSNSGDSAAAIVSAQKAAEAAPSVANYDYLGFLSEETDDTKSALEAYKKALESYLANPPTEDGQVSADYYRAKIAELEAQL